MTHMQILALYSGLFVLLFIGLKINAGRSRSSAKVSIGDGGQEELQRQMRVQGNAVEDVPIVLIALAALAGVSAPTGLLHAIGGGFFVFRLLHALGLGGAPGLAIGRMIGTVGTLLVMLATGGACLYFALS